MKICFLADGGSIHTVRWVNAMAEKGHDIHLVTMCAKLKHQIDKNVAIYQLPVTHFVGYYLNAGRVKKVVRKIKPDLVHTHYASGYGTLSRLLNFSPTLLSVWGSDVFEFPYQSKIKRRILEKNLRAASQIASTSVVMKKQTEKFVNPKIPIVVTPFGVDMQKFNGRKKDQNHDTINIGMVKTLEEKYGPRYLIEGTALLIERLRRDGPPSLLGQLRLIIVGEGSQLEELKQLAKDRGISQITTFTGAIDHDVVPEILSKIDIYCAPSLTESFGVAVVEASACEIPVIVSDVGGLPEVVVDGETGYIVQAQNSQQIACRLYDLVIDEAKRRQFGQNGRKFVQLHFSWKDNVALMESVYRRILNLQ